MTKTSNRILGVTVLADFVLSEGVQPIVDNLVRAGVTAVATNPTVTAPAPEGTGTFQPPADAGSSPRTFDRKIFGKHAFKLHSTDRFHSTRLTDFILHTHFTLPTNFIRRQKLLQLLNMRRFKGISFEN